MKTKGDRQTETERKKKKRILESLVSCFSVENESSTKYDDHLSNTNTHMKYPKCTARKKKSFIVMCNDEKMK